MKHWIPLLLTSVQLLAASAAAPPRGLNARLAFIRSGAVYVASHRDGPETRVPRSASAFRVSLAPNGGTLIFFTAPPGDFSEVPARGFVSRPPYTRSEPLPAPLDRSFDPEVFWTGDGETAFLYTLTAANDGNDLHLTFHAASGSLTRDRLDADSASRDGRTIAWRTLLPKTPLGYSIRMRRRSKAANTLFSASHPERMEAALRRARSVSALGPLRHVPPSLWRQPRNWDLSPPGLTPDGRSVYFAANAGSGVAADGVVSYCLFRMNLPNGALTVLSHLGVFHGYIPEECCVSPDGRRLLFVSDHFGNGGLNPRFVYVVDLATQKVRELLNPDRRLLNETDGSACWSPDGQYIAADAAYFRLSEDGSTITPRKPDGKWGKRVPAGKWEPTGDDFEVLIFDAATGKGVRIIPHARYPSW